MRTYFLIAVFAAFALFAVARAASTADRMIGTADCTVDCAGHEADADNGIGTNLPNDPNNYDESD
jgi:hypothetical protein